MSTIGLSDLQDNAAALLDRVAAGEHMLVVRDGRAVAELRPVAAPLDGKRPFGLAAGVFEVPADFDAPLPEEMMREFEGQ
jgi:antitoxin (DNA-binding transcriptional repressor) of toxin-antitoxin stability system